METVKKGTSTKVEGTYGSLHSYEPEEVKAFANLINNTLKDDPLVGSRLPINPDNEDIFDKVGDGLIFAKLIEKANPGTIDFRVLNTKANLNVFQLKENLNLVINSAKAVGCRIISIFPESFIEKKLYLILGMSWQVIRILALSKISLADNPYLARLINEGEDLETFKRQNPEHILIRWFNFHLKNAKHNREVHNFTDDVKDGVNYSILLSQLDPNIDLSGLQDDELTRAKKVIENAVKIGVQKDVITPEDIVKGHPKLNLLFTSLIYNARHGLEPKDDKEQKEFEKVKIVEEKSDPNDTREERAFRQWCNSLEITDKEGNHFFFNNLYDDLSDSIYLLKILEKLGVAVDWKKVTNPATNKFKILENGKYAVELCKSVKDFKIINVSGNDIYEKNKKLVLGVIWQMARKHTLETIGGASEDDLLKWANSRVKDVDPIKGFGDSNLRSGKYLLALLASIEPRIIDQEVVKAGDNDEEVESNAKYVISICRSLNIPVFCIWEDIKDVKQKMILVLIASIRKCAESHKSEK